MCDLKCLAGRFVEALDGLLHRSAMLAEADAPPTGNWTATYAGKQRHWPCQHSLRRADRTGDRLLSLKIHTSRPCADMHAHAAGAPLRVSVEPFGHASGQPGS